MSFKFNNVPKNSGIANRIVVDCPSRVDDLVYLPTLKNIGNE